MKLAASLALIALALSCVAPHALPATRTTKQHTLPSEVRTLLARAGVPASGISVYVQEIGARKPLLAYRARVPRNPASTMKIVTTYAALELLGPDYRWRTEAYTDGALEGDVLLGNLYLKGYGDPKVTYEAFASLLAKVRNLGIREIRGDVVQDRSYFVTPQVDPAQFDNEPLKPYNVGPDALLIDFKSIRFVFSPDPDGQHVAVRAEPAPPTLTLANSVELASGECGEWRDLLQANFASNSDRASASFMGGYPAACGEQEWYVSLFDHPHYVDGAFRQVWRDLGGSVAGGMREARVPRTARLLATIESVPLADVVHDVNKFSNNVMARQLFLSLATAQRPPPATTHAAALDIKRWIRTKGLNFPELVLENGSGLSRKERINAEHLARLLYAAYASKVMPDFVSSLPVAAVDGTMTHRLQQSLAASHAYLKTGSLEGVRALAGYLMSEEGQRYVLVAFINDPNAAAARDALDALVRWVYRRTQALSD